MMKYFWHSAPACASSLARGSVADGEDRWFYDSMGMRMLSECEKYVGNSFDFTFPLCVLGV